MKCFNFICEVLELEYLPLALNRETHLHTETSRREWWRERGSKYDIMKMN